MLRLGAVADVDLVLRTKNVQDDIMVVGIYSLSVLSSILCRYSIYVYHIRLLQYKRVYLPLCRPFHIQGDDILKTLYAPSSDLCTTWLIFNII